MHLEPLNPWHTHHEHILDSPASGMMRQLDGSARGKTASSQEAWAIIPQSSDEAQGGQLRAWAYLYAGNPVQRDREGGPLRQRRRRGFRRFAAAAPARPRRREVVHQDGNIPGLDRARARARAAEMTRARHRVSNRSKTGLPTRLSYTKPWGTGTRVPW